MKDKMLVGLGLSAFALAIMAKDPVIMTVNGVDVNQSEFEYLYNKNSQQQMNPQPIDEYVEMFKLYKLKVADAKAEGLDTVAKFQKEIKQYKHELAVPYLTDSTYMKSLLSETYERAKDEVEANHIMFFKGRNETKNAEAKQRADSVLQVLKAGGDFAELAKTLSQDKGSRDKGGRMGYITVSQYPYAFEQAAYSLKEGEISDVVETNVGYHILKGGKHRPARGKVHVAHIMKMTQNLDSAKQAKASEVIDSLYNVVSGNPDKFSEIARQYSDDKGSARQGGMLNWFGAGEMVESFDSVAFSMTEGEISKPFQSQYGWHIIKKLASKPRATEEEMAPEFYQKISSPQDPRSKMVKDRQTETLSKKHKAKLNNLTMAAMKSSLAGTGLDSLFYENWKSASNSAKEFCVIDGKSYKLGDFINRLKGLTISDVSEAENALDLNADAYYNYLLVEAEEDALLDEVPEYGNLYREYVDGSLLYEVSVKKVWDRASKDNEGLDKYFQAHRSEYKWTEPRAKGYLVQTVNDSVATLIKARAAELGRDSLVNTIRKEFPKQVSIMKVLEPKGTNQMIDNVAFGGPKVEPASANYTEYFMLDLRIINEPEDVNDVRGLVTSDYQNEFQAAWEKELMEKYPVKVNEKVLKKVKSKSK